MGPAHHRNALDKDIFRGDEIAMALHVSEVSRGFFEAALKAKIGVIEIWLENGIPWKINPDGILSRDIDGERELDYFPRNLAAFCKWDGSENTQFVRTAFPAIKPINRSTLYLNHSGERAKIDLLCKKLVQLARKQLVRSNKTKNLEDSTRELTLLRAIVARQETEITTLRKSSIKYETKLAQTETALTNTQTYYEGEMANLRNQVSDLTASVLKLRPLRKE